MRILLVEDEVALGDVIARNLRARRHGEVDRTRLHAIIISAAPISQKRIDEFKPSRTLQKPFPMDALIRALNELAPAQPAASEREARS
jgi:hypothetical protein